MFIGIVLACGLVPFIYNITKKQLARDGDSGKGEKINQESRLLFAMIGCVFLPIGKSSPQLRIDSMSAIVR